MIDQSWQNNRDAIFLQLKMLHRSLLWIMDVYVCGAKAFNVEFNWGNINGGNNLFNECGESKSRSFFFVFVFFL